MADRYLIRTMYELNQIIKHNLTEIKANTLESKNMRERLTKQLEWGLMATTKEGEPDPPDPDPPNGKPDIVIEL